MTDDTVPSSVSDDVTRWDEDDDPENLAGEDADDELGGDDV